MIRRRLGFARNEIDAWIVVYNKLEVVEKFRTINAANNFIYENNPKYFYNLEVIEKYEYELRKEKQEKRQKKKEKRISI